jgi:hypothetical protein
MRGLTYHFYYDLIIHIIVTVSPGILLTHTRQLMEYILKLQITMQRNLSEYIGHYGHCLKRNIKYR